MCGIFGIISKNGSGHSNRFLKKSLTILANLSETRGKDSSGLCTFNNSNNNFQIVKGPISANKLLKREKVKNDIDQVFSKNNNAYIKLAFGHARLVTNGTQLEDANNQPVLKDGVICVHNGIVVNADDLWEKNPNLTRQNDIDTEILPSLIREELKSKSSLDFAIKNTINKVFGTASVALAFNDLNKFALATNNGSLYVIHNNKDFLCFASERAILNGLLERVSLEENIGSFDFFQLKTNELLVLDTKEFIFDKKSFDEIISKGEEEKFITLRNTQSFNEPSYKKQISTVLDLNKIHLNSDAKKEQSLLVYPEDKIKKLKRCTKCILPETFPFISFDDNDGECNYCKNYKKKNKTNSLEELKELVAPYRSKDGSPDCLVPFSGGRDSMYVLHIIKKELGLNPIAFTYDWGMVTDLARRNIARICGELGVENIIVAADIHWKRANIRKNIKAWLKKPSLGMIPLFMAGDKYFFYYADKVKKQTNTKLNIWGINHLENTDFKTGFGGLAPQFDKEKIYSLSAKNQLKLFGFVGKNILQSPGYVNQSILDSLGSFASRYFIKKTDYYHLFDYLLWDEKTIENTIINEYKWETCIDTDSTWRIGDGTASFYNYIYTLVAGFSENDTFRSNQIREGMITRDEALANIYEENKPRYNSLKWYLEIVGLDFQDTVKKVNEMVRMY
jgi:glutamine---fructose-6-phosphate transaminase (isomerizing)